MNGPCYSLNVYESTHPSNYILIRQFDCLMYIYAFYVGETKNNLSARINGRRSSSNSLDNLSFPVAIHTKSNKLIFNFAEMHVYFITYPNTNRFTRRHFEPSFNSLYPPNRDLVLSSENFLSMFPPSPIILLSLCSTGGTYSNHHVTPSLLFVHIHLFSYVRQDLRES